ncbi:hypothetical protein FQN60_008882, partial [Etheostoma spectabile]
MEDSKFLKEGGRNDVDLNNFQKEHGKIPAGSFENHKIFHLTVLASPGGSLGTDHNRAVSQIPDDVLTGGLSDW